MINRLQRSTVMLITRCQDLPFYLCTIKSWEYVNVRSAVSFRSLFGSAAKARCFGTKLSRNEGRVPNLLLVSMGWGIWGWLGRWLLAGLGAVIRWKNNCKTSRVLLAGSILPGMYRKSNAMSQCSILESHSAGDRKYVLKGVQQSAFNRLQKMYNDLNGCDHVRSVHDTIPKTSVFVHEYLTDNLLRLVQEDLPIADIKRILRDALHGLVALHEKDFVHTGNQS